MFLFKKIVAPFFFPLSICLEVLFLGLFFLWFTQRQKAGKVLITLGVLLLTVFSYGVGSETVLRSLEYKYPPLKNVSAVSDVKWILILGGGHTANDNLPLTGQLSYASLVRLAEGVRILNSLPKSKLILSGNAIYGKIPESKVMADVALSLGVDAKRIVMESESRDTKDQARLIGNIIGDDRFVLVTSASHMPRAMALFKKRKMNPIPAPIGHIIKKRDELGPASFFPAAGGIGKFEYLFHEYMGLAWAKFRGQA